LCSIRGCRLSAAVVVMSVGVIAMSVSFLTVVRSLDHLEEALGGDLSSRPHFGKNELQVLLRDCHAGRCIAVRRNVGEQAFHPRETDALIVATGRRLDDFLLEAGRNLLRVTGISYIREGKKERRKERTKQA
jgi:hypothetical protein